ncbi:enhancer of split M1 protein [Musca vetustissima]|uniref:enhancer of split M1 protein n=1 Tax=Musca vetustissima TaxID=27455 RepID=UPI002AB711A7|nr:enhancer of split M1 protein [Musca vetustissima]
MFTKSLITLTVLSALLVSLNANPTDELDCPQICPALYAPLCASNGKIYKEFSNECELKASNCRQVRNSMQPYTATSMDWCSTEFVDSMENLFVKLNNLDLTTSKCLKPCAMIYQPVCISNGKYRALASNECLMENINCALGTENTFKVLQAGSC